MDFYAGNIRALVLGIGNRASTPSTLTVRARVTRPDGSVDTLTPQSITVPPSGINVRFTYIPPVAGVYHWGASAGSASMSGVLTVVEKTTSVIGSSNPSQSLAPMLDKLTPTIDVGTSSVTHPVTTTSSVPDAVFGALPNNSMVPLAIGGLALAVLIYLNHEGK